MSDHYKEYVGNYGSASIYIDDESVEKERLGLFSKHYPHPSDEEIKASLEGALKMMKERQPVSNEELTQNKSPVFGEWQLCPKCNGDGVVRDFINSCSANASFTLPCPVCNGLKLLVRPIIK